MCPNCDENFHMHCVETKRLASRKDFGECCECNTALPRNRQPNSRRAEPAIEESVVFHTGEKRKKKIVRPMESSSDSSSDDSD